MQQRIALTLESSSGGMVEVGEALAETVELLSSAATPTLSRASNRSSLPTVWRGGESTSLHCSKAYKAGNVKLINTCLSCFVMVCSLKVGRNEVQK